MHANNYRMAIWHLFLLKANWQFSRSSNKMRASPVFCPRLERRIRIPPEQIFNPEKNFEISL